MNIPPGLTSYIQVLDVSINKPFKDKVRKQSEKHVEENIDRYAEGKIPVSESRILLTKMLGVMLTQQLLFVVLRNVVIL